MTQIAQMKKEEEEKHWRQFSRNPAFIFLFSV